MTDDQLLTVPEAARLLRIGRNLAYELVARRAIPSVRLGRSIRIPRFALEAWLERESRPVDTLAGSPRMDGRSDAYPRRIG